MRLCGICRRVLSNQLSKLLHCMMSLEVILSKLLPHFQGATKLTHCNLVMLYGSLSIYSQVVAVVAWTNAELFSEWTRETDISKVWIKIPKFCKQLCNVFQNAACNILIILFRLSCAAMTKHPNSYLSSYPGYFREPFWFSMGLPEISRVTWQVYGTSYW